MRLIAENPIIVVLLGIGISKSGCFMNTRLGAGAIPGGSVKGVVSGSPAFTGVRIHA